MGIIQQKPEELRAESAAFDRKLRFLALSRLDDLHEPVVEKTIPGSATGVPGGKHLRSASDLFESFDIRIKSAAAAFRPPAVHGDSGDPVAVAVDVRARNRSDFTGAGLRKRRADSQRTDLETGAPDPESNELSELSASLELILKHLALDPGSKDARRGVGSILRTMADRILEEGSDV